MTKEEIVKLVEKFEKDKEAYLRGEISDDMTPECRQDWIEKCNS